MRLLVASTMGAGHLAPLLPFARAAAARGHEVTVAGPPSIAGSVAAAGHPFWALDDPPPDELGAVWSQVPSLPPDQQNVVVVRDIFARLGARARLPRLREACEELRPDVVLRESAELGSPVAAELAGIPHARVATSLAAMEEAVMELAAGPVDDLRASAGLPRAAPPRCSRPPPA